MIESINQTEELATELYKYNTLVTTRLGVLKVHLLLNTFLILIFHHIY